MIKSQSFHIDTGRGERSFRQKLEERVDAVKNGFYQSNPDIKVVSESMALTATGSVILSLSYIEADRKPGR